MPVDIVKNDLYFNTSGDFAIGIDGDLADTTFDEFAELKQEIRNRLSSEYNDWQLHPWLGADMSEIIGEPNSREVAEFGKQKILDALTAEAFLSSSDVNIKYVPISRDSLMYNIDVDIEPTSKYYENEVRVSLIIDFFKKTVSIF